jgi:hypothetical protein
MFRYKRSNQYPLSNVSNLKEKKCMWVLNTCYDVKSNCESITANGDILKCLWLKENTTKNVIGRCANGVYLNNF